jgi:hypothetical protein
VKSYDRSALGLGLGLELGLELVVWNMMLLRMMEMTSGVRVRIGKSVCIHVLEYDCLTYHNIA